MKTTPPNINPSEVRKQVLQECEAMARHALASGLKVPGALIQVVEDARDTSPDAQMPATTSLSRTHGRLAMIVAPATPRTILLLAVETEKSGVFMFLGRVPLVRRMMLAALLFLVSEGASYITGTTVIADGGCWLVGPNSMPMAMAGMGPDGSKL